MKKSARGMTLIELIIVVAIVGIIAAIGYPSYLDHVKKTRRAEGMGELLELADESGIHIPPKPSLIPPPISWMSGNSALTRSQISRVMSR